MEKEKSESFKVEGRIIRLKLVDGTLINGQVNIARGRGYERLSELVSDGDDSFLILFNAKLYDKNGEYSMEHKTVFVNKTHILWVEPDEDQK